MSAIDRVFTKTTPWEFTSSAGAGGSVLVVGAGGGKLFFKNTTSSEENTLYFGGFGPSLGLLPGSFTYSTTDIFSTGLGKIRARVDGDLSYSDMQGPCVILSVTGAGMAGIPEGMSLSIYLLNVSYSTVAVGVFAVLPPVTLASALTTAKAMGMMIGRAKGVDAGITLLTCWAR